MNKSDMIPPGPTRRTALFGGAGVAVLAQSALVQSALVQSAWAAPPSQAYVWRNVSVGAGGFMPGLVFSRVEKGLAYLRSDMGGLYRWDAGKAAWIALQDGMAESSYLGVESVAPDPVNADVVYAAAGMYRRAPAAMLRSADRGATWTVTPVAFRMGGNEDGRGLGERLAVDPLRTSILYYGSRHDGLQRSRDAGRTWSRVESFPVRGRGAPPPGARTNPGLSFVLFDPSSGGGEGGACRRLFVGVFDADEAGVLRSDDAGETWVRIDGCPRPDLAPAKAEIDGAGVVYLTYANGPGPNDVTDGAVLRLDTRSGVWTDISPERGPGRAAGGYMGISLDRSTPGALVVASLNRWRPGDVIWRSPDEGRTWKNLREVSTRDVSATPFLLWGKPQADFGWWICALAIDPFDSDAVAYATGATVYATAKVSAEAVSWKPWVSGIEQTAVLALASPPEGPALLSGFGDIGGFAHEDLGRSPPIMTNPVFGNTNTIDYAGAAPRVIVRSGTAHSGGARLAVSEDFGRSWKPLTPPSPPGAEDLPVQGRVSHPYLDAPLIVSADGSVLMVLQPTPLRTLDRGGTWSAVRGLPSGLRPVADRIDPRRFYALDFDKTVMWTSIDGGATFTSAASRGLPGTIAADQPTWREVAWPLRATPGRAGDLWFVSREGLFRSSDGGRRFVAVPSAVWVEAMDFGKAPPGGDYPALFAIGQQGDLRAIWRSDDSARSWTRVNDAGHEYGRRFRCIAGDPRVYGRVYVGTDGRGILYGDLRTPA